MDTEVHFALSRFETALLDSLIDHPQYDPLLERKENNVKQAIQAGPVAELFTEVELMSLSPLIDNTLVLFERSGLIEKTEPEQWNWRSSCYRLTEPCEQMTENRRRYAAAGR